MACKVVHNEGQARLFENKNFLEMLTKTHPLIIWGVYIPILAYLVYRANVYEISGMTILLLFVSGMLYWTFFEYMAYRYLFHMVSDN